MSFPLRFRPRGPAPEHPSPSSAASADWNMKYSGIAQFYTSIIINQISWNKLTFRRARGGGGVFVLGQEICNSFKILGIFCSARSTVRSAGSAGDDEVAGNAPLGSINLAKIDVRYGDRIDFHDNAVLGGIAALSHGDREDSRRKNGLRYYYSENFCQTIFN